MFGIFFGFKIDSKVIGIEWNLIIVFILFSHMQEKGVMLQDHSMRGPHKSGAKALMNTIMQLRSVHVKCDTNIYQITQISQ